MKGSGRLAAVVVALFVIAVIWVGFVNMGLAYAVIVGGSATLAYFA